MITHMAAITSCHVSATWSEHLRVVQTPLQVVYVAPLAGARVPTSGGAYSILTSLEASADSATGQVYAPGTLQVMLMRRGRGKPCFCLRHHPT
jgi:hypothetical protein